MKSLITALLITFSMTSIAQTKDVNIHDNGKTLKLKYKSGSGDNQINFENAYDVSGWSQQQKDQHIRRVIDSLHTSPAIAGTKSNAYENININEDGDKLTLTVDYRSEGQNIKFTDTYSVKGKSKEEKDAMVKKVLEGLGIKR